MSEKELTEYALLPEPRTVRLRFCKTGAMQYISHLDLQRSFTRILARADLPVWFTQGFNPHPKITFGLPLPVGCESVCELVDIRIVRDMPCEEILRRMHNATASNLDFTACYEPKTKLADIAAAGYEVRIDTCGCRMGAAGFASEAVKILTAPSLRVMKHSKSGDKETDIIPLIKKVRTETDSSVCVLRLLLAAGQTDNLNPGLVLSVLQEKTGWPADDTAYSVMRLFVCNESLGEFI